MGIKSIAISIFAGCFLLSTAAYSACDLNSSLITSKKIDFLLWNVEKNKGVQNRAATQYFDGEDFYLFQEINSNGVRNLQKNLRYDKSYASYFWTIFNNRKFGVASLSYNEPCDEKLVDVKDEPFMAKVEKAIIAQKFAFKTKSGASGELLVVNVHLPLFVLGGWPGKGAYKTGLKNIDKIVRNHCGPVVVAGDFNGWSPNRRFSILPKFQKKLKLSEINFDREEDGIISSTLKLDRVFYRGLNEVSSNVVKVDPSISDHHVLKFGLEFQKSYNCGQRQFP